MIKVKLFATLREGRGKEFYLDFDGSPTTTQHILDRLEIPSKEVAILMINGMNGELDKALNEGDTLSIFPPVGGG